MLKAFCTYKQSGLQSRASWAFLFDHEANGRESPLVLMGPAGLEQLYCCFVMPAPQSSKDIGKIMLAAGSGIAVSMDLTC